MALKIDWIRKLDRASWLTRFLASRFIQDPRMTESLGVILGINMTTMTPPPSGAQSQQRKEPEKKQQEKMETDEPENVKKVSKNILGNDFFVYGEIERERGLMVTFTYCLQIPQKPPKRTL